ncbi:MAG: hypothetical protein SPK50_07875 [Mobiluncus porci]|uniref:Type II toxin-antitoxin system VapC family toxin n=1 Tax=Mobiluncus porci TaxID=2652278 RepID=A0A7K0K0U5_9ACTO|nr:hypothetical protein [Mobiluncus porci]MDD7542230.1 hypothetical protein [Mobiluncus porci]MDY5749029.1 hypothetical protein [Mobiluncus porci]MST48660.1 type II toxin-antitoxin system VapC family toxin [Mobiluncus porci]
MKRIYIDTSALVKLVIEEAESDQVAKFVDAATERGDELIISRTVLTNFTAP